MPPKLDKSSNSNDKIFRLYALFLFSKKEYSLTELADMLNCTKQTILRLMDAIELNKSIKIEKFERRGRCYYQSVHARIPAQLNLSIEELKQLIFCKNFFQGFLSEKQKKLLHINDAPNNNEANFNKELVNENLDFAQVFELLSFAFHNHSVLEVTHFTDNTQSITQTIMPVRIRVNNENLYLQAWLVNEKGPLEIIEDVHIALCSIQNISLTERRMSLDMYRENPFPSEEDNTQTQEVFGVTTQKDPFPVKVRFFPPAAKYIMERQWSFDQVIEHEENSIVLNFTAQSDLEVVKWLLSFGKEAQIIEPKYLRKMIIDELKTSIKLYK